MSGLQIFNAHPALYWGKVSTSTTPFVSLGAADHGQRQPARASPRSSAMPSTRPACSAFRTTGRTSGRARLPELDHAAGQQDLATGRRWHFFFAWLFVVNGLVYLPMACRPGSSGAGSSPRGNSSATSAASIREHLHAAVPPGRRGQALQRPAEARLSRRDRGSAAASGPGRVGDVAGHGQRRALAAHAFRRPAIGPHDPLHHRRSAGRCSSSSMS